MKVLCAVARAKLSWQHKKATWLCTWLLNWTTGRAIGKIQWVAFPGLYHISHEDKTANLNSAPLNDSLGIYNKPFREKVLPGIFPDILFFPVQMKGGAFSHICAPWLGVVQFHLFLMTIFSF